MANEYGRWFVRNDPQTWRRKMGAYDRPFSERYQRPSEYTPSVEEYRHYPAMKNIVAEQEEKKNEQQQSDASKQSDRLKRQSRTAQNAGRNVGNIVKNLVGRVVAVVAGGAIVVSAYQTIAAENAKANEDPTPDVQIVKEIDADWDNWNKSDLTIMVKLKDSNGNVLKEIPAEITVTEVAPTCTKEGSKTYTATAEDEGNKYSDTYTDTVDALGHKLDGGKTDVDENGDPVIIYECSVCHDKIKGTASAEEND